MQSLGKMLVMAGLTLAVVGALVWWLAMRRKPG